MIVASATPNRAKIVTTCFLLFCFALFLSAYSARRPKIAQVGRFILAEITTPISVLAHSSIGSTKSIWDGYISLIGVREENRELRRRLAALESENSRLEEAQVENRRLKRLLGVSEGLGIKGIAANIIGHSPSNWVKSLTIDRGSADGIALGQPVIENDGIVGHIIAVARNSSEVLLVTDHASAIDVLVQSSRARGIVEGSGDRLCKLSYVEHSQELKVGDRIISTGIDGLYPKGLLVGIVTSLERENGMFQRVEVRPSVNFAKLESVLVISSPLNVLNEPQEGSPNSGATTTNAKEVK